MRIFDKQLEELGESQAYEFEQRVMRFVTDDLAGGQAREVSRDEVRRMIKDAHDAGLGTERQVVAYVAGEWLFGETFLQLVEPLRDRLGDDTLSPNDKARLVLDICDALAEKAASAK